MGVNNSAFVAPSKDCFSTMEGHLALEAIVGVRHDPLQCSPIRAFVDLHLAMHQVLRHALAP